jgi:radical SAM superfamily enzyme YgiQ (UPF0313 family)
LDQVRPLITQCRQATAAPIVVGGAGYSIFPVEALAYLGADWGIWGDGELAFPALLHRLEEGRDPANIPGVQGPGLTEPCERKFPDDLDALPFADEEFWAQVKPETPELWLPLQTRRGCPHRCLYCSTPQIQGTTVRSRRPEEVVEHVRKMSRLGFRRFIFVDNSFNIPESYALELCQQLAAQGLPIEWRCIIYPQRLSEELVRAMKRAGCVEASLGFESGCDEILARLKKRFTTEDVRQGAALLAQHGIRRWGFLLLGGPGETRQTVEKSLTFCEALKLEARRITVGIRIYPGTELARLALDEGLIEGAESLLFPRFYLVPELVPWIYQRLPPAPE